MEKCPAIAELWQTDRDWRHSQLSHLQLVVVKTTASFYSILFDGIPGDIKKSFHSFCNIGIFDSNTNYLVFC